MVLIMLGSVCVNAIARSFDALDSEFTWRAGVMCATVPWAAFLIKTFYFDLCQVDLDTPAIGRHATEISTSRAALWSLLHLPLIGCICWVSVSLVKVLLGPTAAPHEVGGPPPAAPGIAHMWGSAHARGQSAPDDDSLHAVKLAHAPHGRWQLCAAFIAFIVIGTLQQSLHRGSGRGSRRCGKRRRMLIRMVGLVALAAMQAPLARLGDSDTRDVLTVGVDLAWLSFLAATEVAGLRFIASTTSTALSAQIAPTASAPSTSLCVVAPLRAA